MKSPVSFRKIRKKAPKINNDVLVQELNGLGFQILHDPENDLFIIAGEYESFKYWPESERWFLCNAKRKNAWTCGSGAGQFLARVKTGSERIAA